MPNITGRDSYLITKALFYTVHFIDGLPEQYQARSDRSDMLKILRTTLGDGFETDATMFGRFLEKATGRPLNVEGFPEGEAGEG
jgi:hypothetical protein